MLTRDEQDLIMKKVMRLVANANRWKAMVHTHKMSEGSYRESVQRAKDELADMLKELG